jgi:hypothetical protein
MSKPDSTGARGEIPRPWRIAKWNQTFENAESRRVSTLSWVAWPIKLDSAGYDSLIEEFGDDSPAMYGAWCALVCVAASCEVRGTLADSKGRPYTIGRIARKAHMPEEAFERLIEWASTEDVAWLELADCPETAQGVPRECQEKKRPRGEERRREDILPPSLPPLDEVEEIVVDDDSWLAIADVANRISKAVTMNPDMTVHRLASADKRLSIRAAALAEWRYGNDWLVEIIEQLEARKTKLNNGWSYLRKTLIGSVLEQFGDNYKQAERLVINRIGQKVRA